MSVARSKLPSSFVRVGWSCVLVQLAEQIALTAAPLVAVLLFAATPTETALLHVAHTLPFLVLAIPVGLIVDRTGHKAVLIASETLRAVTLGVTVVLLTFNVLTLPMLVIIGFVGAIGTVAFSVAAPAVVPQVVAREQLTDANRWLELGRSAAFIGGPAFAGLLAMWLGAPGAFVAAATICAFGVLLLTRLYLPSKPAAPSRPPLRALREGASFAWSDHLLRPIMITSFAFNIGWFVIQAVFVVYAVENLSMGSAEVGLTLAVYGVGMVLGAGVAPAITRRLSLGRAALIGPIGGFAASTVMTATLLLPTPGLAAVGYFLFGAGPVIWAITTTSIRQAITEVNMLGRVSSLFVMATYGARPIGAGLAALASILWGSGGCLVLASALFAAQLAYVARSRLAHLRALPADTQAPHGGELVP
jgi:MFS family permease